MTSRINWKQSRKKFGWLKSKRQHKKLNEGKPMNRNVSNPKTRSEDKEQ
jgi:hypothetical protein